MIKKYIPLIIAMLLIGGYSCTQTNQTTSRSDPAEINFDELSMATGKEIVESVCISCHDPKNSVQDRIAPPLEIVKRNYLTISENERAFIANVTNFVMYPTVEQAKLHSDVEEFGVMDPLGFSKQEIQSVAMFIYRTELERPDWMGPESNND